MPDSVTKTILAHALFVDAVVGDFIGRLEALIAAAQGILVGKLQGDLIILPGGVIEPTDQNLKTQYGIGKYFKMAMERAGYAQIVHDFTATFAGNFPYFDQILGQLAAEGVIPSGAVNEIMKTFEPKELETQIIGTENALLSIVDEMAAQFVQTAALNVGALKFSDLVQRIILATKAPIPQATTIAVTAQTNFFRTLNLRGFEKIEGDLNQEGRYFHAGPDDIVTRPMCHHWLSGTAYQHTDKRGREVLVSASTADDATYTLNEIAKFKNGFGSDPRTAGGGVNCRHVEVLRRMENVRAIAA